MSTPTRKPALVAAVVLLLMVAVGLAAATANAAEKPCWERVIDDWLDNGRFDGVYSTPCLEEARRHLPEDLRAYSDFEEKLDEALLTSTRTTQGRGGGETRTPTETRPNVNKAESEEITRNVGKKREVGPIRDVLNAAGPTSADTIPLPLIILAGLALLLLAAGAAGVAQRKLKARKIRSS